MFSKNNVRNYFFVQIHIDNLFPIPLIADRYIECKSNICNEFNFGFVKYNIKTKLSNLYVRFIWSIHGDCEIRDIEKLADNSRYRNTCVCRIGNGLFGFVRWPKCYGCHKFEFYIFLKINCG